MLLALHLVSCGLISWFCLDGSVASTGYVDKGSYVTDFKSVASNYVLRGFLIDAMASCPVSWVGYFLVPDHTCEEKQRSDFEEPVRKIIQIVLNTFCVHSFDHVGSFLVLLTKMLASSSRGFIP
jgi:hypothetical protein